ncbi:MAG: anti-sigma factor [Acidobacteriota bacterium]|nr:anti-sigma factor [Acidobacteriota bacterium]
MSKTILGLAVVILGLSAATAFGQTQPTTTTVTQTPTTVTKTVQHPDGTYTVIEYPVGKEVQIALDPITHKQSKGVATILRDDNGTRVVLNLSDVPADVTAINLYAVDDTGAVTLLGPVAVTNGAGTLTTTTPLSKFMLIASPEATLTAYDPNTRIFFRSAVPEGFAVIPHTTSPVGERVAASTTPVVAPVSNYTVPMLNLPAYKTGDDTKMKINFSGALTGAHANVFIKPRKDGPTEVKLRFHELKDAPSGKIFSVWAVSPDNKFVKLGQVVSTGQRNEAEIKSDVALPDFGLLVTMEDATGSSAPMGPAIGLVEIVK